MAEDSTPILRRKCIMLAKAETTTGTPIATTGTDGAFNIYNPELESLVQVENRETQGGFNYAAGIPGVYDARLRFESDLCGNGALGLPAWASVFLPPCGMSLTGSTYTFGVQDALKTLTARYHENGRVRGIAGAVGTFTIPLLSGRPARIQWEFYGKEIPDADASFPSVTLPTVNPPRFANASAVTLGSFTPRLERCTISAGNEMVPRHDANDTTGIRSGLLVDRVSRCEMDPEATLVATRDWQTLLRDSTSESLVVVVGTVANNIITVTAGTAQPIARPAGDRNKIRVENVALHLRGESPFSIAFS